MEREVAEMQSALVVDVNAREHFFRTGAIAGWTHPNTQLALDEWAVASAKFAEATIAAVRSVDTVAKGFAMALLPAIADATWTGTSLHDAG